MLTAPQRALITGIADLQRPALTEIVKVRRATAVQVRRFMKEEVVDKEPVLALARRYGQLDGEIAYYYATRFAEVNKTLTPEQREKLMKLRNLDGFVCKGAFLYSRPMAMPDFPNTDFLFAAQP